MALTRKMLAAMDIPAEKIDEIISAHSETVNAIKEERETFKAEAEKVSTLEKQLETAKKELEEFKTGDWENKYKTVNGEYTKYKADVEAKTVKSAKEAAYKQLLLDAGISDKRIASVLKVSDIDGVELDKDGKIKDADKITENVKSEWADFIVTKQEKGADVPNPPANNGGEIKQPNKAAEMAAKYYAEHYGNKTKEE
jgi:hypothetical protein